MLGSGSQPGFHSTLAAMTFFQVCYGLCAPPEAGWEAVVVEAQTPQWDKAKLIRYASASVCFRFIRKP